MSPKLWLFLTFQTEIGNICWQQQVLTAQKKENICKDLQRITISQKKNYLPLKTYEVAFPSGTWQKEGEITKFIWDPVGPCCLTKYSLQGLPWHEMKFSLLQQKHQEGGKFCVNTQQATKMDALPCQWGEHVPKLDEEQSLGLLGLTWWCPSKLWSGVSSEGERAEGWCCHRGSLPPSQEGRKGKTVIVVLPWVVQFLRCVLLQMGCRGALPFW